jgi:hypothetical protein
VNGAIRDELRELYKLRARLRSQIARLDSQIVALDRGPLSDLRRVAAGNRMRHSNVPHFQPSDGRA